MLLHFNPITSVYYTNNSNFINFLFCLSFLRIVVYRQICNRGDDEHTDNSVGVGGEQHSINHNKSKDESHHSWPTDMTRTLICISNWHACILGLEPSSLGIRDGFSEVFIKQNQAFHDLLMLRKLHPLGNHSIRLLGSQQLSIMCFQLTLLIDISQLYRSSNNQLQALWVKLWLTVLWHLSFLFHEEHVFPEFLTWLITYFQCKKQGPISVAFH
jgi:hypothetical protein